MGKTTIGRMIAMCQMIDGWDAIECKAPKEFHDVFDSKGAQIFVADDFFGRTEYDPARVSAWQDELPYILRRLDRRHWLVLTTRAHLLQIGRQHLDVAGENDRFPQVGEVIVNAADLTPVEKARILYRHAKSATLPVDVKAALRDAVLLIITSLPLLRSSGDLKIFEQRCGQMLRNNASLPPSLTSTLDLLRIQKVTGPIVVGLRRAARRLLHSFANQIDAWDAYSLTLYLRLRKVLRVRDVPASIKLYFEAACDNVVSFLGDESQAISELALPLQSLLTRPRSSRLKCPLRRH